jgi:preprotein translocase subunit Sec61beta
MLKRNLDPQVIVAVAIWIVLLYRVVQYFVRASN